MTSIAIATIEGLIASADSIVVASITAKGVFSGLAIVVIRSTDACAVLARNSLERIADSIEITDIGTFRAIKNLAGSAETVNHTVTAIVAKDILKDLADIIVNASKTIATASDLLKHFTNSIIVALRLAIATSSILKWLTDTVVVARLAIGLALSVFTITAITIDVADAITVGTDFELLKRLAESIVVASRLTIGTSSILSNLTRSIVVAWIAFVGTSDNVFKVIAITIRIARLAVLRTVCDCLVKLAETIAVADALWTTNVLKDVTDIIKDAWTAVGASLAIVFKGLTEAVKVARSTIRAGEVLKVIAETIKVAELAVLTETILKVFAVGIRVACLTVLRTKTDRLRVCADGVGDTRTTIRDTREILREFAELIVVAVAIRASCALEILTDSVGDTVKTFGTVLVLKVMADG